MPFEEQWVYWCTGRKVKAPVRVQGLVVIRADPAYWQGRTPQDLYNAVAMVNSISTTRH